MAAITKSDREHANTLIKRYEILEGASAKLLVPDADDQRQRIKSLVRACQESRIERKLDCFSVASLELFGYDSASLEVFSVDRLSQVLGLEQDVTSLSEAGQAIVACVTKLRGQLQERVSYYPDVNNRVAKDTELLTTIHQAMGYARVREERSEIMGALSAAKKQVETISSIPGPFKTFFMADDERAEIINAINAVESSLTTLEGRWNSCLRQYNDVASASSIEVWDDYDCQATLYTGFIDDVMGKSSVEPLPEPNEEAINQCLAIWDAMRVMRRRFDGVGLVPKTELLRQITVLGEQVRREAATEQLSEVSVDCLASYGEFDIPAIKRAGNESLADLVNVQHSSDDGNVDNNALLESGELARQILKSLYDITPCIISQKERSASADELVTTILKTYDSEQLEEMREALAEGLLCMQGDLEKVWEARDVLDALFMPEDQHAELLDSLRQFRLRVNDLSNNLLDLETMANPSASQAWAAYEKRKDQSDILILRCCGGPFTKQTPHCTHDIQVALCKLGEKSDDIRTRLTRVDVPPVSVLEEQVSTCAHQIVQTTVDTLSSQIELDALRPLGIGLEPLRNEGIQNVLQLYECGQSRLKELVGAKKAEKLGRAIVEIRLNLRSKTPCLIDDSTKPDWHRLLINRIVLHGIVLRVGDNHDKLLDRIDEDAKACDELRQQIGSPDSLFVDRETWRELGHRTGVLDIEVDACSAEVDRFARQMSMAGVDEWSVYKKRKEVFDKVIETIAGTYAARELPFITTAEALESERLTKRYDELNRRIKKVKPPAERTQKIRIRRLAREVREKHTHALMDDVWVEQFGASAHDYNTLAGAGFKTASDVWDSDEETLAKLIGEQSATKVFSETKGLHDALYDDMPCRIDLDKRDGTQARLLSAVLEYECLEEAREMYERAEAGMGSISDTVDSLEGRPYVNRLVMTSDERASFLESLKSVGETLAECENCARQIEDLIIGDEDSSAEFVFHTYESDQTRIDDLISRITGSPQNGAMPVVTVDLARRAGEIVARLVSVEDVIDATRLPSQVAQGEVIRNRVDSVRREYARQLMSRVETASLSWARIDPTPFRELGIENFLSLYNYVEGLDEPQEEEVQVRALCEAILEEIQNDTPCLLDSENRPDEHSEIVLGLYMLIKTPQITSQRSSLAKRLAQSVDYRRFFSRKGGGTFSVSMTPAERIEFAKTVQKLEEDMPPLERGMNELTESISFDVEDAWSAYSRLNNVFERVLHSVAKSPENDTFPQYDWDLAVRAHHTLAYAQRIVDSAVMLKFPTEEDLIEEIDNLAYGVQDLMITELLAHLEVEALEPFGINLDKLKAMEFETVGQISAMSLVVDDERMSAFEKSRLLSTVREIERHLESTLGLVIDPATCTEDQYYLLTDVYIYRHYDSLWAEYDGLMNDLARCFPEREVLESRIGFFGNLFVCEDRREKIGRARSSLDAVLPGLEQRVVALSRHLFVDEQQVLEEYEAHSDEYDVIIQRIGNLPEATGWFHPCGELARRGHYSVARLAKLDADTRNLMPPNEREQRFTICALADDVREEYVKELLAQIPVGAIAPSGVDVVASEACGLANLAQVREHARGSGDSKLDQSMQVRLRKVADDVHDIVRDLTPCLIDAQNQPASHARLVATLVRFKHLPEMVRMREQLKDDVKELMMLGAGIESGSGYIANLFMNDERRAKTTHDIDDLERGMDNARERLEAICRGLPDEDLTEASEEEWTEYLDRRDFFDDLVHTITGSPVGEELPSVTVDLALDGLWAHDCLTATRAMLRRVMIVDSSDAQNKVVREAREVRVAHMERMLSSMSADVLEPLDIDVTELKSFGYANIQELRIAGFSRLYEQLGSQAAVDLFGHIDHIRGVVWNAVPCAIESEPRDEHQVRLVQTLVTCASIERVKTEHAKLVERDAACREHDIVLGMDKGYLNSLCMTAERREEFHRALSALTDALPEFARRTVELHYRANNVPEYAWMAYQTDSERYDSVLRSITNYPTRHSLPVDTSEIALKAYSLLQRLGAVRDKLADLDVDAPEDLTRGIEESIAELRDHEAKTALRGISVDSLSNIKVRPAAFRRAGFSTLEDLLNHDEQELVAKYGIRPSAAQKVANVVKGTYKSCYERASRRIDSDNEPAHQVKLLEKVYLYLVWRHLQERREDLQDAGMSLNVDIADLAGRYEYVSNLVMSEERLVDIQPRVNRVDAALPQLEEATEVLERDVSSAKDERPIDIWGDFRERSATYNTIISEFDGGAGELAFGDLPDALVQQVMAHPLDLRFMHKDTVLRDYQRFAARYTLLQQKVLVGDEMGLGKTIEALGVISHLVAQKERNFIIVCPLSVIINWEREILANMRVRERNLNESRYLTPCRIYGPGRAREFRAWCLHGGIAITSYDTVGRLEWGWLRDRVSLVVVDEAHYIKNPKTRRSKAIREKLLPVAENILFLTGTPLENELSEMNAIISYLNPQLVERIPDDAAVNPVAYREHVAPVYLRRKREDVLTEIPERVVKDDWCILRGVDKQDYLEVLSDRNFSGMRCVGWRHGNLEKSAKATRFLEIYRESKANGSKMLVFSFFLDTLSKVESLVSDDCAGVITGSLSAKIRQQLVDDFTESDKSVLIAQVTAGGVGLNIQAASVVVFCEPQLKPSIEEQAISRAHRMGQLHKVVVHRLLMADTVDDGIETRLKRKREAFNNFADISQIGQQSLGIIDSSVINEIIEEEREKYNVDGGTGGSRATSNGVIRHG